MALLSFRERRELSELPGRIRVAETEIADLVAVQAEIEEAFRRWESLEAAMKELEAVELSGR